jgi:hypothetical protein
MSQDFGHRWPVRRLQLEHALDQIFEVLTEVSLFVWLVLAVGPPENVSSVGSQAPVEWVIWLSGSEWRVLGNHDEKNDCGSKKIHRFPFVWLLQVDFWRHVVQGTELGVEVTSAISSFDWGSESKISNFEDEIFVEEKIFWLKVSVSETLLMAKVEAIHELLEVVSGNRFLESSRNGNEIEKFSSESQL